MIDIAGASPGSTPTLTQLDHLYNVCLQTSLAISEATSGATSSPSPISTAAPVVYTQSPTTHGSPYLSYQTTIQGGPKSPKGSKKFPGDQKGGKAKSPKQKRY
jgi:hypothetical protein